MLLLNGRHFCYFNRMLLLNGRHFGSRWNQPRPADGVIVVEWVELIPGQSVDEDAEEPWPADERQREV